MCKRLSLFLDNIVDILFLIIISILSSFYDSNCECFYFILFNIDELDFLLHMQSWTCVKTFRNVFPVLFTFDEYIKIYKVDMCSLLDISVWCDYSLLLWCIYICFVCLFLLSIMKFVLERELSMIQTGHNILPCWKKSRPRDLSRLSACQFGWVMLGTFFFFSNKSSSGGLSVLSTHIHISTYSLSTFR